MTVLCTIPGSGVNDIEVLATVTDGDEALAAVMDQQPDVLLTDIEMPGRSGLDTEVPPPGDESELLVGLGEVEEVALDHDESVIDLETTTPSIDIVRPVGGRLVASV